MNVLFASLSGCSAFGNISAHLCNFSATSTSRLKRTESRRKHEATGVFSPLSASLMIRRGQFRNESAWKVTDAVTCAEVGAEL